MKQFLLIAILLPVMLCAAAQSSPNLTAVFDAGRHEVHLKWLHNESGISAYRLERSSDNTHWEMLYNLKQADFSRSNIEKFTDKEPAAGKNYYRLAIIGDRVSYSASLMLIIGEPTNSWIMYPVPVGAVLYLQYNGSMVIPGVITVFIQNSMGKILTRLRCASVNRRITVPVDNLGRGIYDIRIIINDEVVWNQRFLK